MIRKQPRRRLRIRRKRKGKRLAAQVRDEAGDAAVEVVGEYGCLVVESVISVSVLALLIVPACLLIR